MSAAGEGPTHPIPGHHLFRSGKAAPPTGDEMDAPPALPDVFLPPEGPVQVAGQLRESKLTRAYRITGIIRDVLFVLIVLAFLVFGVSLFRESSPATPGVVVEDVEDSTHEPSTTLPCEFPVIGEGGAYCPETPGG